MPLSAGIRLGHYDVTALLAQGRRYDVSSDSQRCLAIKPMTGEGEAAWAGLAGC